MQPRILKGNCIRVEERVAVIPILYRLDGFAADVRDEFAEIEPETATDRHDVTDGRVLEDLVELLDEVPGSRRADAATNGVHDDFLRFPEREIDLETRPSDFGHLLDLDFGQRQREGTIVDVERPSLNRQVLCFDNGCGVRCLHRAIGAVGVVFVEAVHPAANLGSFEPREAGQRPQILRVRSRIDSTDRPCRSSGRRRHRRGGRRSLIAGCRRCRRRLCLRHCRRRGEK